MKTDSKFRTLILYKTYFSDFYKIQTKKVKDKVVWVLRLIECIDRLPEEYFSIYQEPKVFMKSGFRRVKTSFVFFAVWNLIIESLYSMVFKKNQRERRNLKN